MAGRDAGVGSAAAMVHHSRFLRHSSIMMGFGAFDRARAWALGGPGRACKKRRGSSGSWDRSA